MTAYTLQRACGEEIASIDSSSISNAEERIRALQKTIEAEPGIILGTELVAPDEN